MIEPTNGQMIDGLIHQIVFQEQANMDDVLMHANVNVNAHQMMILTYIEENPGVIQKDIVTMLNRTPATVSAVLTKLEKAGLLERKTPADNSRNKQLFVAPEARNLITDFRVTRNELASTMVSELNETEQATLIQLLQKLV
ncbi:MarR family transcriptional regulator [Weissella viridescens]|uniref:MarR family transcriptional regulator n=1 Tax=Weissella viridescens TaxID=1629 RepID=A0A3P2RDQ4_WEIVI|nr:MarR family transcriptional regulator [Weissella viridescens]RRG18754.1 MarR family transcriptional regulator [Weissella viridescens]